MLTINGKATKKSFQTRSEAPSPRPVSDGEEILMRAFSFIALIIILSAAVFGQSAETPATFEIADIHASPRSTALVMRTSTRPGRYELHNATMLDLIRTAYGYDDDKILGGTK